MAGRRRGDAGERRRGHAARARERVCVRLINQTFAFGILAREKEEEIVEEEVAKGQEGGRGGGAVGQAGSSTRPEPGQAEPGTAVPFQEPTSEFRISLSVPRFSSSLSPSLAAFFIRPLFVKWRLPFSTFRNPFFSSLFVSLRSTLFFSPRSGFPASANQRRTSWPIVAR